MTTTEFIPVNARAKPDAYKTLDRAISATAKPAMPRLVAMAKEFSGRNDVPLAKAYDHVCRDNEIYAEYRREILGLPAPPMRNPVTISVGTEPFLAEVKSAEERGASRGDAVMACAKKRPDLYKGYVYAMRGLKTGTQIVE